MITYSGHETNEPVLLYEGVFELRGRGKCVPAKGSVVLRVRHALFPRWPSLKTATRDRYTLCMSGKNKETRVRRSFGDLDSPESVERFREAAASLTRELTTSKASAKRTLIEEGIYSESGELTKNYRS
jgi:hypothetical protein